MINTNELKAQIKRAGTTQEKVARDIGMNPATLSKKLNNEDGAFTVGEAYKLAEVLDIPRELLAGIFFAPELAETQEEGVK